MPKKVSFEDVVEHLVQNQNEGYQNNILLGNGFNLSLDVDTSYQAIFEKMKNNNSALEDIQALALEYNYDVEKILEEVRNSISVDESQNSGVKLKSYIGDCVDRSLRTDFIRSTVDIVDEEINMAPFWGDSLPIRNFLGLFGNYFSTNFDPLLYLIFLRFRYRDDVPPETLIELADSFVQSETFTQLRRPIEIASLRGKNESVTVQALWAGDRKNITDHFFAFLENDKAVLERQLSGTYLLQIDDKETLELSKKQINTAIKMALNSDRGIERDVDDPLKVRTLQMDDGFRRRGRSSRLLHQVESEGVKQNVFYLHGAFHLFLHRDETGINRKIRFTGNTRKCRSDINNPNKIGSGEYKFLLSKIKEEVRLYEDCLTVVLKSTSEEKDKEIQTLSYLQDANNAYRNMKGTLVILGCSLAQNDVHLLSYLNGACEKGSISRVFLSYDGKQRTLDGGLRRRVETFPAIARCIRFFSHREIKNYDSCRGIELKQDKLSENSRAGKGSSFSGHQLRLPQKKVSSSTSS